MPHPVQYSLSNNNWALKTTWTHLEHLGQTQLPLALGKLSTRGKREPPIWPVWQHLLIARKSPLQLNGFVHEAHLPPRGLIHFLHLHLHLMLMKMKSPSPRRKIDVEMAMQMCVPSSVLLTQTTSRKVGDATSTHKYHHSTFQTLSHSIAIVTWRKHIHWNMENCSSFLLGTPPHFIITLHIWAWIIMICTRRGASSRT